MTKYEKNKKLWFGMRIDDLFRIRLQQLALKHNLSESELIRKYINEDYANYGQKITSELKS
jgi:hypothetical protein